MKKITKAAIAAAVGGALLLGGGGTFALWNSSAPIAGGTITAGNLLVSDPGPAGTWKVNGQDVVDISAFKAVPGDVLVFTKTMSITATGDNLVATLALGEGSITPVSAAAGTDVALSSYLTKTATLTASGPGISGTTVTAGTAGVSQNVTVAATITFPKDLVAGLATEAATKTGKVSLTNMNVTLTQN